MQSFYEFELIANVSKKLIDTCPKEFSESCPISTAVKIAMLGYFPSDYAGLIKCFTFPNRFTIKIDYGNELDNVYLAYRFDDTKFGKQRLYLANFVYSFDHNLPIQPFAFKVICKGKAVSGNNYFLEVELIDIPDDHIWMEGEK